MNHWARNRKRFILGLVFLVLLIVVGIPSFLLLYQKPTCGDGKQNGDEAGIDCGGSCQRLCVAESLPLVVKGDPRILKIATSTYEVVALVENLNQAEVASAKYTFKLFTSNSLVPVKTIAGSEFVGSGQTLLFQGPFQLENNISPVRATLEWENSSIEFKKSVSRGELDVKNIVLSQKEGLPRIEANVKNLTLKNVSKIDLSAVIFDQNGNIFAASKTFIERLKAGEETKAVFTWPSPFNSLPAEIKVISRVLP